MSKEKYYTPEKDEFHIGFEYEAEEFFGIDGDAYYGDPGKFTNKSEWYKCSFPDKFVGYNIDKLFMHSGVRVKYLDKDDIESLGFIYKKSTDLYTPIKKIHLSDEFYLKKDIDLTYELLLYYNGDNTNIDICLFSQELCNNGEYSGDEYMYQISLNIKNKSELKIVLQQLNITEN